MTKYKAGDTIPVLQLPKELQEIVRRERASGVKVITIDRVYFDEEPKYELSFITCFQTNGEHYKHVRRVSCRYLDEHIPDNIKTIVQKVVLADELSNYIYSYVASHDSPSKLKCSIRPTDRTGAYHVKFTHK